MIRVLVYITCSSAVCCDCVVCGVFTGCLVAVSLRSSCYHRRQFVSTSRRKLCPSLLRLFLTYYGWRWNVSFLPVCASVTLFAWDLKKQHIFTKLTAVMHFGTEMNVSHFGSEGRGEINYVGNSTLRAETLSTQTFRVEFRVSSFVT